MGKDNNLIAGISSERNMQFIYEEGDKNDSVTKGNKDILAGAKATKWAKGNGVVMSQKHKLGSIVLKPTNGRFEAKESVS